MNYRKRTDNKEAFKVNAFKKFTDTCGGDLDEFTDIIYNKYTIEDFAYGDDIYYWGILGYFEKTVIPHKIAVYEAGIELSKTGWVNNILTNQEMEDFKENLWLHDISKFSANEAFGYAMYNRKTGHGKDGFDMAWHHHKMNNPHHPEYWFSVGKDGSTKSIPMPMIYIIEMLADWIGAGKTYGSSIEDWMPGNLHQFNFGVNKSAVMNVLDNYGIKTWIHEGGVLRTHE